MAFVNCPKCDYAFDPLERYCPRCDTLYTDKEAYESSGPVPGLPHAVKPSKSSLTEPLNKPTFQPTKKRHEYGPPANEIPRPLPKMKISDELPEYKKSGNGGKILAGLVIIIILLVVYYVFVK